MDGAQYLMVLGVVQRHDLLRDLWFECLCSNQHHSAYLRICRRTLYAYGSGGSEKVGAAAMSITIWSVALAAAGKGKFARSAGSWTKRSVESCMISVGGRRLCRVRCGIRAQNEGCNDGSLRVNAVVLHGGEN